MGNRDDLRKVDQHRVEVIEREQTVVHHQDAQEPRKLVIRQDNDVVHIVDAGTTEGVRHLDAPKSEYLEVVWGEENNVACCLELSSRTANRKNEHCTEWPQDLVLE